MITTTTAAAGPVRLSAEQGHMKGMPLCLAAKRNSDASIHYGMGFDDGTKEKTVCG